MRKLPRAIDSRPRDFKASHLVRSEGGNLTVMTSLVFAILLGFAGLAVDAPSWYSMKRSMQTAVDSAAMAAAYEMSRSGATMSAAVVAAEDALRLNGFGDGLQVSLVNGGAAVEATLTRPASQYLSGIFLDTPPVLHASARARLTRAAICLLALEPEASGALSMTGASSILAPGCRLQINSTDAEALTVEKDASITALSVCVGGGFSGTSITPLPDSNCPPAADPLEELEPPEFSETGCIKNLKIKSDTTLSPGVYCGGIDIQGGTVTLQPGIYVITGGKLKIMKDSDIIGDGVMFYLDGDKAVIDAKGEGKITLRGMKSGPYKGVIFFQDRTAKPSVKHKFKKTMEKHYEGTIYLPTAEVEFSGAASASTTSPYSIYIARTFSMSSDGSITINANFDESDIPLPQGIDNSRSVTLIQ